MLVQLGSVVLAAAGVVLVSLGRRPLAPWGVLCLSLNWFARGSASGVGGARHVGRIGDPELLKLAKSATLLTLEHKYTLLMPVPA